MKTKIYEYYVEPLIEVTSTISQDEALIGLKRALDEKAEEYWELVGFDTIEQLYPYEAFIIRMKMVIFKRIKESDSF